MIENIALMHKPQHLRTGTVRMKANKGTDEHYHYYYYYNRGVNIEKQGGHEITRKL